MIEFRVLGSLDLKGPNGETLLSVLAQPKRVALLAYLAVASPNGFHRRDKLLGLFWPERDQEHGRAALRKALYFLRQSLGDEVVVNRGDEEVGLAEGSVWCDAAAFEQTLEGGELEKAVDLYAGLLLDGFHLGEADEFERWLEGARQRLATRYSEALEALADRAEEAGQFVSAVGWWQRLAAQDPYNSRVAMRLMEALAAAGDRANALQHAEEHERRLREELEIEPDEGLRALVGQLKREPAPAGHTAAPVPTREGRRAVAETKPVDEKPVEPPRVSLGRALATYALVSLGVLVAVHIFTLQLGLPDWFFRSVVVLLLAGLPVVVVTSFLAGTPGAKGWVSWRNTVGVIVLAFVLLGAAVSGYMTTRAMGIGPWGTLIGKGVLEERDLIVLADFEDHTNDTLAYTVTEALRVDLGQSRSVRVAGRDYVGPVLERMEKDRDAELTYELAREVAIREGLKAVVSGDISRVGSSYVLSVRLVAAETGEELYSLRETAEGLDPIIPAIDRLSRRLRERIGESLKTVRGSPPLYRVQTASLEALRLRTEGGRAHDRGDYEQGIDFANRAIEIDTLFASAYRLRSRLRRIMGIERAQAIKDAIKAYELRHRLPLRERYFTEAYYHQQITRDHQKVVAAYSAVAELQENKYWPLDNIGWAYLRLRDYARADSFFRRCIELDSVRSSFPWTGLIQSQFLQGEFAEAERTLGLWQEQFPGYWAISEYRSAFASARGDYEAAETHIREYLAAVPGSSSRRGRVEFRLASLVQLQGKVLDAEGHLRRAMSAFEQGGLIRQYLYRATSLGRSYFFVRGLPDRALEEVDAALRRHPLEEMDPLDRPYIYLARYYAQIGKSERAKQLLSESFEAVIDPSLRQATDMVAGRHRVLANIALAERRLPDAIREFRAHRQLPMSELPSFGRALEMAGEPDSAIAVYERYVTYPALFRVTADGIWLPYTYERLGDLYEQRGDSANAVLYYGRLVELWKDADPELQPRVEAARRAIQALTPDR